MDLLYQALSFYQNRKYDECANVCTEILKKNPLDKASWVLKMKALTKSVYVDDLENEIETIADEFLDDNIIAESARAGTSLRNTKPQSSNRPQTEVGHLVTGVVRTNLRSARSTTMEQSLKSAIKSRSARPISTQGGRYIRIGTASMLSQEDGPFIDISKLNLTKYATDICGKHLYEYLYYHESDIQSVSQFSRQKSNPLQILNAMQLAIEAAKATEFKDWWWTVQVGKCYYTLSFYREAEQHFRLALKQHINIDIFMRLVLIYKKLDQPLNALDVCKRASEFFPDEILFMKESARIHEALNNITMSINCYRNVILKDASNIEAIACVGLNYFYTDQPEIALRFYKRLLEMGLVNAEVMNNMGLCCFYSQQYDIAFPCFRRALAIADSENAANIWFNLSHIAIGIGDVPLANYCLRLCLSINGNHVSALNNLAVLEIRKNNLSHANSYLMAAIRQAPFLFEPNFNHAKLAYQCGDLQTSYKSAEKALELSPSHVHTAQLLEKLKKHFMQV